MRSEFEAQHSGRFLDRREAGTKLAEALAAYRGTGCVVLGIPRGGVPVAAEVAQGIGAELDIVVARKVGAPDNPEFAIGAVTANGGQFMNEAAIHAIGIPDVYLKAVVADETAEAQRREKLFRGKRKAPSLKGRIVIVVDDGLATGATMRAAVRSVRKHQPTKVVVAVPVGSEEVCEALCDEADAVVCYATITPFFAVGAHYERFEQVSDDEVVRILQGSLVSKAA